MKDELASKCRTKFIGLRPKLYSFEFLTTDGSKRVKNTAKGVQKAMKNRLAFDDYEACLTHMNTKIVEINRIRSDHHKLYTYNINKIGLSAFDDKRYILDDGITTLARGYHQAIVNSLS